MEAPAEPVARRGALPLVVVAAAVAFLVAVAPWATQDFGYSLDGFNGSVWGLGARAAADDPIGSRLGGIQPDGDRYANHPPLTVWAASIGSAVSGDRSWAVRAPAVLASVLALVVLAGLMRDAGLGRVAAGAGVVVAASTGMFLTYGAMLDTPVVSLPFGLAALAVAQRGWQGRPPATWAVVIAGALAALSSWQGALVATLAAGVAALGATRAARRTAVRLGAGVAVGVGVTALWVAWVHGGLGPLFDQAGVRSGASGSDAPWARAMGEHLTDLFGPPVALAALVGLVALGLLVRPDPATTTDAAPDEPAAEKDGRTPWWRPDGARPLLAVVGVTVVGYTLLFRNGAAVHDYWTYWGVALVGLAVGTNADRLVVGATRRGRAAPAVALVAALAVTAAVAGQVHQPRAERRIRDGLDLLPVLDVVPHPADPTLSPVAVYRSPGELPWADHLVHGRARRADDLDDLRDLPPDLPVLVILRRPPSPQLRDIWVTGNDRFALVEAADLVAHFGG